MERIKFEIETVHYLLILIPCQPGMPAVGQHPVSQPPLHNTASVLSDSLTGNETPNAAFRMPVQAEELDSHLVVYFKVPS
ncbi:hypothetical protein ACRALDRAFT_205362 [Sodiomyces alcalophilus JCM 7366]|uniref:uncharacterized protein n=1 Tax=Sodiomyces alcalophilus JCM 7366 TaxID=591952 RepID=UPI0039B52F19